MLIRRKRYNSWDTTLSLFLPLPFLLLEEFGGKVQSLWEKFMKRKEESEMIGRLPTARTVRAERFTSGLCRQCLSNDRPILKLTFGNGSDTAQLCPPCEGEFYGSWVRHYYRRLKGRASSEVEDGFSQMIPKKGNEVDQLPDELLHKGAS